MAVAVVVSTQKKNAADKKTAQEVFRQKKSGEPRRGNSKDTERVKANAHRSSVAGLPALSANYTILRRRLRFSSSSSSYILGCLLSFRASVLVSRLMYELVVCVFVLREIVCS